MAEIEAFEPQHLEAPLRQMPACRRPHGADAGDDDIASYAGSWSRLLGWRPLAARQLAYRRDAARSMLPR